MNRIDTPPIFDGIDLVKNPVQKWLRQFNRWIIIHDIPIIRKREIMETVLDSPALEEYNEAVGNGGIVPVCLVDSRRMEIGGRSGFYPRRSTDGCR